MTSAIEGPPSDTTMQAVTRPVIVLITGMSGSGKSTALRAFEDRGFFCVDNLPVPFLRPLAGSLARMDPPRLLQCYGVDVRDRALDRVDETLLAEWRAEGFRVDVIFVDASDEMLVRRFSQTRRPHPLMSEEGVDIASALHRERSMLRTVRDLATTVIDTSWMSVHGLKGVVFGYVDTLQGKRRLAVNVVSFGFKYGLPLEADLVFDLRFLPNPYFIDELRPLTGEDAPVREFVLGIEDARLFLDKMIDMVSFALPRYIAEGKPYATIAVGCTGGKHRSVALSLELAKAVRTADVSVHVRHRDLGKE